MPNTEVKLLSADCSEGFPFVRVGRRHAFFLPYGGLAQLGEHLPYKQRVGGSIPSVPTSKETTFVYQTKVVSLQLNPPFRVE